MMYAWLADAMMYDEEVIVTRSHIYAHVKKLGYNLKSIPHISGIWIE